MPNSCRRRRLTPLVASVAVAAVAVALSATGPAAGLSGPATDGALVSTSALSSTDVWAAGYSVGGDGSVTPLAEHWDGTAWTVTPTPLPDGQPNAVLQGIVAVSAKNVWAVGSSSLVPGGPSLTLAEHWNGKRWKVVPTPQPAGSTWSALQSVTATSAHDVWAVGYFYDPGDGGSVIEHWDGSSWSVVGSADPADAYHASLQSVSGTSAKDVWAAGLFFDPSGAGVTLTEHWNGRRWKLVPSPNSPNSPDTELHAVSAVAADDVWATGFTTLNGSTFLTLVEHWDGTAWSIVASPNPTGSTNSYLYGAAGLSSDNAWATGYYFMSGAYHTFAEHWNGRKWKVVDTPDFSGGSSYLFGVSAVSRKDVWAGGFAFTDRDVPFAEHWDGTAWRLVPAA